MPSPKEKTFPDALFRILPRLHNQPRLHHVSRRLAKRPSSAAKKIGELLEERGFKKTTYDEPGDQTWALELPLSNPEGGSGYLFDVVVYKTDGKAVYLELDGPGHDDSRDKEKARRAKKAGRPLLRWRFKKDPKLVILDERGVPLSDAAIIDRILSVIK